jgi:hypothetical protein
MGCGQEWTKADNGPEYQRTAVDCKVKDTGYFAFSSKTIMFHFFRAATSGKRKLERRKPWLLFE